MTPFENYAFVHEVFHLFPSLAKDTVSDKDVTGPVENRVNDIRQVRGVCYALPIMLSQIMAFSVQCGLALPKSTKKQGYPSET